MTHVAENLLSHYQPGARWTHRTQGYEVAIVSRNMFGRLLFSRDGNITPMGQSVFESLFKPNPSSKH